MRGWWRIVTTLLALWLLLLLVVVIIIVGVLLAVKFLFVPSIWSKPIGSDLKIEDGFFPLRVEVFTNDGRLLAKLRLEVVTLRAVAPCEDSETWYGDCYKRVCFSVSIFGSEIDSFDDLNSKEGQGSVAAWREIGRRRGSSGSSRSGRGGWSG